LHQLALFVSGDAVEALPASEAKSFSHIAIDQHIDHNNDGEQATAQNAKDRMIGLTKVKQVEQNIEPLQHQRDPIRPGFERPQSVGQDEEQNAYR
jgi:hypothetical protein